MDILMMLIFPIHEHGICFYLLVSSLISFFSVAQIPEYKPFASLVRFIRRYFIFLVATANGIFFLISVSDISLLVYKNAFCPGQCGSVNWVPAANQRVASSFPSQGTCLGCRPGPKQGVCKRLPCIDVSLPLFPPSPLSKNK